MAKSKDGPWRTLDDIEIALMKRMKLNGLARDYIMSFFTRPGRVISPAVTGEILEKRPEISPATNEEVSLYISRRLSESNDTVPYQGFGPTSQIRVREILHLAQDGQQALPGLESLIAEFKRQLPADKASKAKLAKTMAAFANHRGGYIFFGISDSGKLLGIPSIANLERIWDEISDVVTGHFTPFFRWDRGLVEVDGKNIAVIYIFDSPDKPIICSSSYGENLRDGEIYFRYNRSSECIKAGDLLRLLERRNSQGEASIADKGKLDA